jgi:hypothetical protein
MLRTTAFIISALTTNVSGMQIQKPQARTPKPATKLKANPCSSAVLKVNKNVDVDIAVALHEKVLIPSEITSTPADCPYKCSINIDNKRVVSIFDSATGDLVVYIKDENLIGKEINWTITCESVLSKSKVSWDSWLNCFNDNPE